MTNPLAGYDQWKTAAPPDDEEEKATCPECGFNFLKAHCVLGDEGENYHAWCLVLRLRRKIDNLTAERDDALESAAHVIDDKCAYVLGKQTGKDESVDLNLRMVAVLLPALAESIRALKEAP
jgi:hypothetical protein